MKTKQLFLTSLPLLAPFLLGCGEAKPVDENIQMAKTFVAAMQKGNEAYNGLVLQTSFDQQYKIAFEEESEETTTNYSCDYHSYGEMQRGFSLDLKEGVEINVDTLFKEGGAYFEGSQAEIAKISRSVKAKEGFGRTDARRSVDYAYRHGFGIQFDQKEVAAYGINSLQNKLTPANGKETTFHGKIQKSAIEECGSDAVETAISRLLYLDAWKDISDFRTALNGYFATLSFDKDDAVTSFIASHSATFQKEEGNIKVSFSFNAAEVFKALVGHEVGIEARIPATFTVKEDAVRVDAYHYDFKDAYRALVDREKEGKKAFEATIDSFSFHGKLMDAKYSEMKLQGTFTEYTNDQMEEFLTNFEDIVIPHIIDVEVVE